MSQKQQSNDFLMEMCGRLNLTDEKTWRVDQLKKTQNWCEC